MKYDKFLSKPTFQNGNYTLVSIRKQDMEKIRKWRNEQIDILRQNKIITKKEQETYYNNVIRKTFSDPEPECILFSFLLNDKCIGYGGFVHIDWVSKRAELSFLTQTNRNKNKKIYQKDFSVFLKFILHLALNEIGFNKIFTETFQFRHNTIETLEKFGFVFEGRLKQHIIKNEKFFDSLIHRYLKKM